MTDGRIVNLIGASRGIGRTTALRLAADRYRLVLCGRDSAALESTRAQIEEEGGQAWSRTLDITDASAVDEWFRWAAETTGVPDVCIMNAGVGHWGPIATMTDDQWHDTINVNLDGVFYCTRAALRFMIPAGRGHLVYLSSVMARRAVPNMAAYTASKAAVAALADSVGGEVRSQGIKVTVLYPGTTATEMRDHQVDRPQTRDIVEEDRQLAPEDIADAVAWALEASPRSFPTGIFLEPLGNH